MVNPTIVIIDNAFNNDACKKASDDWPAPDWYGWHAIYQNSNQRKRACNQWKDIPISCADLLRDMLSLDVNAFFSQPLIPDLGLWGGGMHDMGREDVLGIHLDADTHAQSGLKRTVNSLLFLNDKWTSSWGGTLEIVDSFSREATIRISPVFNRLVLFLSTDSWHGVPIPLTCPKNIHRKTLACWWYTKPNGPSKRKAAFFG